MCPPKLIFKKQIKMILKIPEVTHPIEPKTLTFGNSSEERCVKGAIRKKMINKFGLLVVAASNSMITQGFTLIIFFIPSNPNHSRFY